MLLLSGCANDSPPTPPFELELPVAHSVLDNGLELVVVPNHTAPLVHAVVAFRVGSAVETAEVNGYSHLFEHMMFQGSRAVPDSQDYRDQLDALGAADNAYTSVDDVAYYFSAPSASLDGALELMAGALREPELDSARLDKERRVVLSEADLAESEPTFASRRVALEALFGDYTVRLDPLGSREVVSTVSRDELLAMHERYYVPNNALLVLSGDVTVEQGRSLAARHFGDWARGTELSAEDLPTPPPFERSQYEVMTADVSRSFIDVRWRGPSQEEDPEGALAGQLLAAVTSLVGHQFRSLVREDAALNASLTVRSFRHAGYVQVQASMPFGNEAEVLRTLAKVLERLGEAGGIESTVLETAREEFFQTQLQTATEPNRLAFALAEEFGLDEALSHFDRVEQFYALDRAALQRFVRHYLQSRPRVVVLTSSKDNLAARRLTRDWLRRESEP